MDKNHERFGRELFDPQRPLNIDPDDHVLTLRQCITHLPLRNSVVVAEDPRPFQQLIILNRLLEFGNRQEVVVDTFSFSRPRVTRSRSHGEVVGESATSHAFDQHILADAGRAGI